MAISYTKDEMFWIWLSSIEGIGPKRFYELVGLFGSPVEIWSASSKELEGLSFLGSKTKSSLISAKKDEYIEKLFRDLEEKQIRGISRISPYYPQDLSYIFDPPPVLFVKGNQDVLTLPKNIAIVGSRRCTHYGLEVAEKLACELSQLGITIVSGMARGIDTAAHKGSLAARGATIAVLGCGVDVIYPPENNRVYKDIMNKGVLVSEYLPGTLPLAQHFPARNRIISGMSSGVVVVEAAEKSGAMITVDFALEQGREVFAVPGNINSKYSVGPNRLLKEGARLVTDVYDIMEELNWGSRETIQKNESQNEVLQLDLFEHGIVELLEGGDLTYDDLVNKTGFPIQKLNSLLTMLELRGIIKQLPGKIFSRQQNIWR
ncbi:MAG: DNA-processing protein DprA [Clostridia bacterium]|jgi:DNA processing protein